MLFDVDQQPESGLSTANESIPDNEDDSKALNNSSFETFDGSKREPLYAASAIPYAWELSLLLNHFHPSVSAFAKSMHLPPHHIAFSGDPSTEFSVTAFLNRFAYKNPKKSLGEKSSGSVANSAALRPQLQEEPINTVDFSSMTEEDVSPEKMFFYKYFGDRQRLRDQGKSRNRSRRALKDDAGLNLDGDAAGDAELGEEGLDGARVSNFEDEEAEMDAFADKLALDMMKAHDKNFGDPDFDDDEDDDDDDISVDLVGNNAIDDDDDDEDDDDGPAGGAFDLGVNSDEDDDEDDDEDEDELENEALDFEDFLGKQSSSVGSKSNSTLTKGKKEKKEKSSKYVLQAYGDGDDDEVDNDDDEDIDIFDDREVGKKSKFSKEKKSKSGKKPDSDFADAADFEDEMEAIVRAHSLNAAAALSELQQSSSKSKASSAARKPGIYDISSDVNSKQGQGQQQRGQGSKAATGVTKGVQQVSKQRSDSSNSKGGKRTFEDRGNSQNNQKKSRK